MEEVIEVDAGRTIIEQDEQGHGFFILESGSLEIYKDDVLLTTLMYPGTIFGEMGDILGKPRTCTVRAKADSVVVHIPAGDMGRIIQENPDIALKIIKTLANRLERTTQKLSDQASVNSVWAT